jgi:hypothetical protein
LASPPPPRRQSESPTKAPAFALFLDAKKQAEPERRRRIELEKAQQTLAKAFARPTGYADEHESRAAGAAAPVTPNRLRSRTAASQEARRPPGISFGTSPGFDAPPPRSARGPVATVAARPARPPPRARRTYGARGGSSGVSSGGGGRAGEGASPGFDAPPHGSPSSLTPPSSPHRLPASPLTPPGLPPAYFSPTSVLASEAAARAALFARGPAELAQAGDVSDGEVSSGGAEIAEALGGAGGGGWAASSRFRASPSKSPLDGKPTKPAGTAPGTTARLFGAGRRFGDKPSTPPATLKPPADRGVPRLQASAPGRIEQQLTFRRSSNASSRLQGRTSGEGSASEELKDTGRGEGSSAEDDGSEWSPQLALRRLWPLPPGSGALRVDDGPAVDVGGSGVRM